MEESVYDGAGRVVASRVGAEAWTCATYDGRGRVTSRSVPANGAEPARTVTHTYGVGGNPLVTSVADPAGTVTTTVDLLGRVVSHTDVWAKTTSATYDQAGRLVRTDGPPGRADTDYDGAGRPTTQRLGDQGALLAGPVLAQATYDGAGELASASYPSGLGNGGNATALASVGRDQAGRLTALTWTAAGGGPLASDEVTRSKSGRVVDEKIDGVDARPEGPNFTYDPAGRLTDAWVPGHALTYRYGDAPSCPNPTGGRNTNRTSTTDNGAPPTTYKLPYGDRQVALGFMCGALALE